MEEDNSYISEGEARPREYSGGSSISSGKTQSFRCPSCGSYNTEESVYYEKCRSCGWEQGY